MVNSPITMAKVRKAPDSTADLTFGRMILNRIVGQPAPRLCAASVSERMSIDRNPVSTARYMYGRPSVT